MAAENCSGISGRGSGAVTAIASAMESARVVIVVDDDDDGGDDGGGGVGVRISPCETNTIGYAINNGSDVVRIRPRDDLVDENEEDRLSFGVSFEYGRWLAL
ncbi:hypothetical protein KGF57_002493 [Candida theae]|uniref:Uncharacterized protein n=1 Tax=Candida theae TaxID=1198502 RepID=A0AAD5BF59_9ASCO|nr:uncharacterized protein KGF57_002493 [Candida theae]KAI5958648.1 hypothetical protein KGF57_002493 [Candida theae]